MKQTKPISFLISNRHSYSNKTIIQKAIKAHIFAQWRNEGLSLKKYISNALKATHSPARANILVVESASSLMMEINSILAHLHPHWGL